MALQQAVGATLGFSAALPATWTAPGFAALTYITVGQLSGLPDLDGEYDITAFNNLTTGEESKFSEVFRSGEGVVTVGFDDVDVGQIALQAAVGNKGSFKFTLKNGKIYYRTGVIRSFKPTGITTGGVVMAEISVAFERATVKV